MEVFMTYHGRLEAAKRKTRSSVFAKPSICTNNSVFIRRLPSCSLLIYIIIYLISGGILHSYLLSLMAESCKFSCT